MDAEELYGGGSQGAGGGKEVGLGGHREDFVCMIWVCTARYVLMAGELLGIAKSTLVPAPAPCT